jgi:exo-beta-1,3-glucanase (GH17 family)
MLDRMRKRRGDAVVAAIYASSILVFILMMVICIGSAIVKERDGLTTIEQLEQRINTLQAEVYALSEAVDMVTGSQVEMLNDMTDVIAKVEYFGNTVYGYIQNSTKGK